MACTRAAALACVPHRKAAGETDTAASLSFAPLQAPGRRWNLTASLDLWTSPVTALTTRRRRVPGETGRALRGEETGHVPARRVRGACPLRRLPACGHGCWRAFVLYSAHSSGQPAWLVVDVPTLAHVGPPTALPAGVAELPEELPWHGYGAGGLRVRLRLRAPAAGWHVAGRGVTAAGPAVLGEPARRAAPGCAAVWVWCATCVL